MEVNNDGHKDYIFKSLAKKWRDHRYNLYSCAQCDPDASRESNIAKKPEEIPLDQWVSFIDYRARPDIKVTCVKFCLLHNFIYMICISKSMISLNYAGKS